MELGIPELLIILVIIVLLWGPGRLSKIGGELGAGIKAFKDGLTEDEAKKATEDETPSTQFASEASIKPSTVVEKTEKDQ